MAIQLSARQVAVLREMGIALPLPVKQQHGWALVAGYDVKPAEQQLLENIAAALARVLGQAGMVQVRVLAARKGPYLSTHAVVQRLGDVDAAVLFGADCAHAVLGGDCPVGCSIREGEVRLLVSHSLDRLIATPTLKAEFGKVSASC